MIRLHTPTRYYLCCVQQDLFGTWEVWRAWGGRGAGLGNSMRDLASDEAEAQALLDEVLRLRKSRGYQRIEDSSA